MDDILKESKDFLKENYKDFSEVIKERAFSPMYFYFIIAWIVANWKFVYVLLFVGQDNLDVLKLDYMLSLYSFSWFWPGLWSVLELIVVPIVAAFLAARPLSSLWEVFFERYEQNKINKDVIKRKLNYAAKVIEAQNQRKIRDTESDKNRIAYEHHEDFNEYLDSLEDLVEVSGYKFRPSEVLYRNDYEAYKEALEGYMNTMEDAGDFYQQQQNEIKRGK